MISLAAAAREILAVIEANRELDALCERWRARTAPRRWTVRLAGLS